MESIEVMYLTVFMFEFNEKFWISVGGAIDRRMLFSF